MTRGIFITGTDTAVGKTYVTASVVAELRRRGIRAAAFKPIACGQGGRNDAKIYRELMNNEVSLEIINPIWLKHPLAPIVAAKLERRTINLRRIFTSFESLITSYEVVLVEGAGGLLVPIKRNYFVADLARELALPLVVVARLGLGTINHSLLAVRQARATGLRVLGIVLNDTTGRRRGLAEKTNAQVVPVLCGVPLLGVVQHGAKADSPSVRHLCDNMLVIARIQP